MNEYFSMSARGTVVEVSFYVEGPGWVRVKVDVGRRGWQRRMRKAIARDIVGSMATSAAFAAAKEEALAIKAELENGNALGEIERELR